MHIHFLRNATLIIQSGPHHILVDPMLGRKGSLPPYTFIRTRPRLNPLVDLPENAAEALANVTAVLITHCRWGHFDHLDPAGWGFLVEKGLSVYSHKRDEHYLRRRDLKTIPLTVGQTHTFLDGEITPITAVHGHNLVGKLMGPGVGYLIRLPGEPSLYLSGDTVLTPEVRRVLTEIKPDIAVLAAGTARLDVGRPILMPLDEMLEFIRLAPRRVIATHLEALNHCPTTRDELAAAATAANLQAKLIIPQDGEMLSLN